MKQLARRVSIAWLFLVLIVSGAAVLLWSLLVGGAAPRNAVLITLDPGTPVTLAREGNLATAPPAVSPFPPLTTPVTIAVYVTGNVVAPGVYTLPAGSRVNDAVAAAGGFTAEANKEAVNLAETLSDAEHITVPGLSNGPASPTTQGSPAPSQRPSATVASIARRKLNVNTATADELDSLPGIGPVLAQRIIAYRQTKGPFSSVDELEQVQGIGTALLAKLRDLVTVGP